MLTAGSRPSISPRSPVMVQLPRPDTGLGWPHSLHMTECPHHCSQACRHAPTAALQHYLYDDLFTVTCNQCPGGLSLKECTDTVLSLAMVVVTRPAPAPMHYNYTNQLRLRCLRQAVLARMTLKTDYSCDQTSVTFVHLFRLRFDTFNS